MDGVISNLHDIMLSAFWARSIEINFISVGDTAIIKTVKVDTHSGFYAFTGRVVTLL